MPSSPFWDIPTRRKVANEFAVEEIRALLDKHGLTHLKARSHGRHLVVYSEEPDGERVSRIRFTRIGEDIYELGISHHTGTWASTPFSGSIEKLLTQATNELSWLLAEF